MWFKELFSNSTGEISVFAFYGPSGTGKSFRAKLVAHKFRIKAIIDDGLLIFEDNIAAGRSAKLEKSYMAAVRVALFDDKDHRDEVAKTIQELKLTKILILGTSRKMVEKIAIRLQLPLPERYIRIEDIATKKQMEQAQQSRQIEGKHVIPVRAYEVKDSKYNKIFVDRIRVALARRKILKKILKAQDEEPSANTKIFEKAVVRPSFSITERKNMSQAYLARKVLSNVSEFNENIRLKKLSIKADSTGYRFIMKIDIPFGEQLIEISNNLKKFVIDGIEKAAGILVEDISIVVDKVVVIEKN